MPRESGCELTMRLVASMQSIGGIKRMIGSFAGGEALGHDMESFQIGPFVQRRQPVITPRGIALVLAALGCAMSISSFDLAAAAQQSGGRPQAQSAELKVLERFLGSWEEVTVIRPAEWTPQETRITARSTRKWALNRRMMENRGTWDGANEFIHLLTYDPEHREYRQWYFDSETPVPRGDDRGQWDERTRTFTWKGSFGEGYLSESTVKFIDDDHFDWTLVVKDRSGKVYLDMASKATRRRE